MLVSVYYFAALFFKNAEVHIWLKSLFLFGELNGTDKLRFYRNGLCRHSSCLRHKLLKMRPSRETNTPQ